MRNCLISLFLVLMTSAQTALAANSGGGIVVGNGAGVVESNFQHAYQALEKVLNNCLLIANCSLLEEEKEVVSSIVDIAKINSSRLNRLVFVSEKMNPGFFTTGESETNRIAKTELHPESSIFINTDMLYKADGTPALSFQSILAILVHEVGHQAGFIDHAALDILGAKIANFSENRTSHSLYKSEDTEAGTVVFSVTNFELPIKSSILIFNWNDKKSVNLSNSLAGSLSCKYDSESYDGVEVTNGHFAFDQKNNLSFRAWVKISCYERFSSLTYVYKKNLKIAMDSELNIISLIVE